MHGYRATSFYQSLSFLLIFFYIFLQNLLHCAWSPDGAMVAAGSADRFVYIWDTTSRRIMYKLPGHLGSVNDVDFHKLEPIGIISNLTVIVIFPYRLKRFFIDIMKLI